MDFHRCCHHSYFTFIFFPLFFCSVLNDNVLLLCNMHYTMFKWKKDGLAGWLASCYHWISINSYKNVHGFLLFLGYLLVCLFGHFVQKRNEKFFKKNSFFFNENDDNDDNVKCFLSDEISLNMGKQAFPFSFCYGRSFWVFFLFIISHPIHPSFLFLFGDRCVCVSYPSLWILFSKKNKIKFFFFLKKVEKTATKSNQKIFYLLL